jgi:hypothetical protein
MYLLIRQFKSSIGIVYPILKLGRESICLYSYGIIIQPRLLLHKYNIQKFTILF